MLCLQSIPHNFHADCLESAGSIQFSIVWCVCAFPILTFCHQPSALLWLTDIYAGFSHTIHMPGQRFPHQWLYVQLLNSKQAAGGQKRHYRDFTNPGHLESLALSRPAWQVTCIEATEQVNSILLQRRTKSRAKRHQRADSIPQHQDMPVPPVGDKVLLMPCALAITWP